MTIEERIKRSESMVLERAKVWALRMKEPRPDYAVLEMTGLLQAVEILLIAEKDARTIARTGGDLRI